MLDTIIAHKRIEVEAKKSLTPIAALERRLFFKSPTLSLKTYLNRPNSSGIIAELKKRSPSRGQLRDQYDVEAISIGYMQHGASALSVLTDEKFFDGSLKDLEKVRLFNLCPLLCKDFIVDEYQIVEARAYGADVILLIAAVLSDAEIHSLSKVARGLGLEVLIECHTAEEIARIDPADCDHLGVNSRDLRDFSVSLDRSIELAVRAPKGVSLIAESGIKTPHDVVALRTAGYTGFLIGEHFITSTDPGRALGRLVNESWRLFTNSGSRSKESEVCSVC